MSERGSDVGRIEGLLKQRAKSAENTCLKLHEALDRFEHHKLVRAKAGSKLTVRSLAYEASDPSGKHPISKDTPLSKYPKGHPRAGEYRFPDVVRRFRKLTGKQEQKERKKGLIQKLRETIRNLRKHLLASARANNLLDAENVELKRRNRELEEANARLREENARLTRHGSIREMPAIR